MQGYIVHYKTNDERVTGTMEIYARSVVDAESLFRTYFSNPIKAIYKM